MSARKQQAEIVVAQLQARFGAEALQPLSQRPPRLSLPHIPTSFFVLNQALGLGGVPLGSITELCGAHTCGKTTLAAKILVQAQMAGYPVAYVDLLHTCDIDYLAHCGVSLAGLLLVTPPTPQQAVAMTADLVAAGCLAALVFDLSEYVRAGGAWSDLVHRFQVLAPTLSHQATALLALCEPQCPPGGLGALAAVRIELARERWLYEQEALRGYEVLATITRNRFAPLAQPVRFSVSLGAV